MLYEFTVSRADVRMDAYVADAIPELSRSYVSSLISEGRVLVDGKPVKPSVRTKMDSLIRVDVPEPEMTDIKAENIPLDIAYEDRDLLVINKPQGMVVHPAPGHAQGF